MEDASGNISTISSINFTTNDNITYSIGGRLQVDARGTNVSYATIDVYKGSKTTAESTRNEDGTINTSGLTFMERKMIPIYNIIYFTESSEISQLSLYRYDFIIENLIPGESYVFILHKKNNTAIVIYNINYSPAYSDFVGIGEYYLYAGDYDTVLDENSSTWSTTYGDGIINAIDQSRFVSSYGTTIADYPGLSYNPYDLNGDDVVNTFDQSLFRDNYGLNYSRDNGLNNGAYDFNRYIW
jgi:hypothetical protein